MKKILSIAIVATMLVATSCQSNKAAEAAAAAAAKATADSLAAVATADSLAKVAAMAADTMKADTSHAGHTH